MKWSDFPTKPSPKMLRQFAAASLVFLLAAGGGQMVRNGPDAPGLGLIVVGLLVGAVGWSRPGSIRWLFVAAMMLAFPIGWFVSQVTLVLMFYGIVTPMALLFRLLGRDALSRHLRPEAATYWLPKEQPRDPRRYLRPY